MSDISPKELYKENLAGASERYLAKKHGLTRSQVHGRIYRYKQGNKEEEINFDDEVSEDEIERNIKKYNVGDTVRSHTVVKVEENDDGTQEVWLESGSIKTLDDLLEASRTDLDVWEVYRHIINKWDVTNADGLTFSNWQVKAWLTKRDPIEILPNIQPVAVHLTDGEPLRAISGVNRCSDMPYNVMVVSDPHFGFDKDPITQKLTPYHNEKVLEIALKIFENNPFSAIVWGGDILDCNEWSSHFIDRPEFVQTTQPAINTAAYWMGMFVKAKPSADHIALEGNHDRRLETYMIEKLSTVYKIVPGDDEEAEPLFSLSNLLGLKRMGIEYKSKHIIGDTRFIHGDIARKGGGSTARGHLENTFMNTVFAHVHRRELATETKMGYEDERKEVFAMCPGCSCFTDGRVPGSDEDDNWQNGIGVLTFLNKSCINHQIIKIDEDTDTAFYNGEIYKI